MKLIRKIKNIKGQSLIGVMTASAVGLIVVAGMMKAITHFSDQTKMVNASKIISEIKTNASNLVRSDRAWEATKEFYGFKDSDYTGNAACVYATGAGCCYPGMAGCDINLFYNPTNPSSAATYYGTNGNALQQWVCYGNAFFKTTGAVVHIPVANCDTAKAAIEANLLTNNIITAGEYMVVKFSTPNPAASDGSKIPDFPFKIEDKALTRSVSETTVYNHGAGTTPVLDCIRVSAGGAANISCPGARILTGGGAECGSPSTLLSLVPNGNTLSAVCHQGGVPVGATDIHAICCQITTP